MKKFLAFAVVVILIAVAVTLYQKSTGVGSSTRQNSQTNQTTNTQTPQRVSVVATNLEIPWAIAFLPDGAFLFTERTGNLKLYSKASVSTVSKIADVKVYGEGGLLGVAVDPNYNANHQIYLYYTFSGNGNNTLNRVVKYQYQNSSLSNRQILIDNIPGALHHDGGRLKFGPDGYLYATTGDSQNPSLSQNKNSLAGKILRVDRDGKMAPGNPFNNLAYTYGNRNPEGLAWDPSGRLWETEHGDLATDEVNVLVKGANYGWPNVIGNQAKSGIQSPFVQSGAETWAPSGAVFFKDSLFFGGLKGQALFELKVENGNAIITKHLLSEYGRIRDVVLGPDNLLYITTSNRDGRGSPTSDDDRIIKVDPTQL